MSAFHKTVKSWFKYFFRGKEVWRYQRPDLKPNQTRHSTGRMVLVNENALFFKKKIPGQLNKYTNNNPVRRVSARTATAKRGSSTGFLFRDTKTLMTQSETEVGRRAIGGQRWRGERRHHSSHPTLHLEAPPEVEHLTQAQADPSTHRRSQTPFEEPKKIPTGKLSAWYSIVNDVWAFWSSIYFHICNFMFLHIWGAKYILRNLKKPTDRLIA